MSRYAEWVSEASWEQVVAAMRSDVRAISGDEEHAWRVVLRLQAAIEGFTSQLQRALDLNASEMRALLALWDGGAMSISELGVRVNLSRPAATTLADRLEMKGLAKREASGSDRRRVELHVTQLAERQLAFASTDLQKALAAWVGDDSKGWVKFVDGVAQVRDAAQHATKQLEQTPFSPIQHPGKPRRKNKSEPYW